MKDYAPQFYEEPLDHAHFISPLGDWIPVIVIMIPILSEILLQSVGFVR